MLSDLRERAAEVGGTYWAALLVFGLLAIGGLYALVALLTMNPKPLPFISTMYFFLTSPPE